MHGGGAARRKTGFPSHIAGECTLVRVWRTLVLHNDKQTPERHTIHVVSTAAGRGAKQGKTTKSPTIPSYLGLDYSKTHDGVSVKRHNSDGFSTGAHMRHAHDTLPQGVSRSAIASVNITTRKKHAMTANTLASSDPRRLADAKLVFGEPNTSGSELFAIGTTSCTHTHSELTNSSPDTPVTAAKYTLQSRLKPWTVTDCLRHFLRHFLIKITARVHVSGAIEQHMFDRFTNAYIKFMPTMQTHTVRVASALMHSLASAVATRHKVLNIIICSVLAQKPVPSKHGHKCGSMNKDRRPIKSNVQRRGGCRQ